MDEWAELEQCCANCGKCGLADTRTNVVFGVGDRNAIVFGEKPAQEEAQKEETITFTPGPGVTAIVHGQDAEADTEENVEISDPDEDALISLWRIYKEDNPEGTIEDFSKTILNANEEV